MHIRHRDIIVSLLRRISVAIGVATMAILLDAPSSADESVPSLSGLATNALVSAYHAVGLDGKMAPPFRLQPFVVVIQKRGPVFDVSFCGETSHEYHFVSVDGHSGKVVRAGDVLGLQGDQGSVMLPGIIAGEIIAAYGQALHDTRPIKNRNVGLRVGLYSVTFSLLPGATNVTFGPFPASQLPDALTLAAPTSTPLRGCMGACAWEYYSVKVRGGKMEIRPVRII